MSARAWNRIVELEGGSNFRDLGGYRTASGQTVKTGKLYRTSNMATLTDRDLQTIGALGIRTICDFRGPDEIKAQPSRLPTSNAPDIHTLSIMPKVGGSVRQIMEAGEARAADVKSLITEAYRAYARDHVAQYRAFFERLTADDRYPIVFHCAAGKDRTGFAAAITLTALGVPKETVFEDYLLTNLHWKSRSALPPNAHPEVKQALLGAHAEYLEAAFQGLDAHYGSFDAYLEHGLGVDRLRRDRLHALLLD